MKPPAAHLLMALLLLEVLTFTVGVAEAAYESRPGYIFDLKLSPIKPLLDEWGRPRRNADGTFYPGDGFQISYSIAMANEEDNHIIFNRLTVEYPEDVFRAEGPTDSTKGTWTFEILKTAKPNTYTIKFKAEGVQRWLHEYEVTVCRTVCEKVCQEVPAYDAEGNQIGSGVICWEECSEECWKETRYEWVEDPVEDIETVTVQIVPYRPVFTLLPSKVVILKPDMGEVKETPTTYLGLRHGGDVSYDKPFAVLLKFEGVAREAAWYEVLWSWITGKEPLTLDRRAVIDSFDWEGEAKTVKIARGRWADLNGNKQLDKGEPVYTDEDGDGRVSPGDTRQTPHLGYPDGSTVEVGDADVGLRFFKGESFEEKLREVATKFWTKRKNIKDYDADALYLYGSSVGSGGEGESWEPSLGVPPLLQGNVIYCRLLFAVKKDVVRRILEDGYGDLWFKVKLKTTFFSPEPIEIKILNKVKTILSEETPAYFMDEGVPSEVVRELEVEPEFTYMADVYAYPAEIKAVKPDGNGGWEIDDNVQITATWIPGIKDPETGEIITMEEIMEKWREVTEENVWGHWETLTFTYETPEGMEIFTATMPLPSEADRLWQGGASHITGLSPTDIQQVYAKPEIEDPTGILIYEYDIEGYGADDIQIYSAAGVLSVKVRKTSPSMFTLEVVASKPGKLPGETVGLAFIPFGHAKPPDFTVDQPWRLYVNMAGGGVHIEKATAYQGLITLKLRIEPEAGGIQRLEVWRDGSLLASEELPDNINYVPESSLPLKPLKVEYEGFGYAGSYELAFRDGAQQPQTYTLKAVNSWDTETIIQFTPTEVKPIVAFTNILTYVLGVATVIVLLIAFLKGLARWRF